MQDIGFRKELTYTRPLRAVESDSDAREHLERRVIRAQNCLEKFRAGCRRCVDAIDDFESRATADGKGGTQRCPDATGE